ALGPARRGRGDPYAAGRGAVPAGPADRLLEVPSQAGTCGAGRGRFAPPVTAADSVVRPSLSCGTVGGAVMSPSPLFAHPVRDPPGRVSRLYEDLSSLGRRLREGIALLAGRHAGDAVRDAVEAALGPSEPDLGLPESSYRPSAGGRDDPYRRPYRDPYAEDAEGYGGYPEDDAWSAP